MDTNAPGQLLGYIIQIPRALVHLLKAGPGDCVCVEVYGDVATESASDTLIAEEDKSSINRNPLTDRSTNLWKTFYNWIVAINENAIQIQKTTFILYTNKHGDNGIIDDFHSATTTEEARKAIQDAKQELSDIKKGHSIWEYYDYVINEHADLLIQVIKKFEFQIGSDTGYDEVRDELRRQHFTSSQIEELAQMLLGWLYDELTKQISDGIPAKIKWDDFNKQIRVLFERFRCRDLIDFAHWNPIGDSDISQQQKINPNYLKQLDTINVDVHETIEAVKDYLKAKVNRDKWIENGIIDEDVADDFQKKLTNFWRNQSKRIELTEQTRSQEDRGCLLLIACKQRQERIRDMDPPASTIAGTYHELANELVLGWHPDWENLFLNDERT